VSETNGGNRKVSYGYDAASNLVSLTYPGTNTVTRGFDALNRLVSVKDWLNNTTSFGYDANGNLHSVLYPSSTNTGAVYSYDRANGIQSIVDETNPTGAPSPFWTFSYSLDGNQQVRTLTDPVQGTACTPMCGTSWINSPVTGRREAPIPPRWDWAMTAPTN
jgi:YD repeat-containing protein